MKKIKLNLVKLYIDITLILIITLSSCTVPGTSEQKLYGNEKNLPDILKGMEVYSVSLGDGDYIKVAVLNNEILSNTYRNGFTKETTIFVDKRFIKAKEIISENDSIIVIRK